MFFLAAGFGYSDRARTDDGARCGRAAGTATSRSRAPGLSPSSCPIDQSRYAKSGCPPSRPRDGINCSASADSPGVPRVGNNGPHRRIDDSPSIDDPTPTTSSRWSQCATKSRPRRSAVTLSPALRRNCCPCTTLRNSSRNGYSSLGWPAGSSAGPCCDGPSPSGTSSSWVTAEVLAGHRHQGIGSALFDLRRNARTGVRSAVLQSEIMHTCADGGERIPSPTGIGDLPATDPGVRFLLHRGYRLEQTERLSFLDLPLAPGDPGTGSDGRPSRRPGPDSRSVKWSGPTPQDRYPDLITLRTRMSTDAPFAGLEMDEEPWTAQRLAHTDQALSGSGQVRLTMAVEHLPTGRLVGFNELLLPPTGPGRSSSRTRWCLSQHRGHRLGNVAQGGKSP